MVNFSFKMKNEKSIVNNIDNLLIELTATGLTLSMFNAAYSQSQAPPVAIAERVKKSHDLFVIFFVP